MINTSLIKRRLLEQKQEAQLILDQKLVKREKQKELHEALNAPLVKVIIGPRRSGKTVLALQSREILGDDYCYLNFDDEILGSIDTGDLNLVLELVIELFGQKSFLILDEIQNVDKWELFVNRLLRANYNIILTGSNSKLLSKELSSVLTGRSLTIELLPFSFAEYLDSGNINISAQTTDEISRMRGYLKDYIELGGFPEVLFRLTGSGMADTLRNKYLKELFDATINRDVMHRHRVRFTRELIECANVITSNFARRTSSRKLAREIGVSEHTLKKYTGFLEEAYLLFSVKKFSPKPLEIEKSIRKYYSIDTGYIHAKGLASSINFGFLMENLVALELKRRGHEFYYYLLNDRNEIDFITRENRQITGVIQVSYDENELREREVSNGLATAKKLGAPGLTIVTWYGEGEEMKEGVPVHFVPLWKWLLNPNRTARS